MTGRGAFTAPLGADRPIIPAEIYDGVPYAVYDIGTIEYPQSIYDKKHEILILWELPELRVEVERDGQKLNLPQAISEFYTLSMGPKAKLRLMLESWRGAEFTKEEAGEFDIASILGQTCQVQVYHKTTPKGPSRQGEDMPEGAEGGKEWGDGCTQVGAGEPHRGLPPAPRRDEHPRAMPELDQGKDPILGRVHRHAGSG